MLSTHLLEFINLRLNQLLKPLGSSPTFGNLSVIAFGDFFQLPPVRGSSLLHKDPGALTPHLWDQFTCFTLDTIMRQKDDQDFALLLNRIRTKPKSDTMSAEDDEVLMSRDCTNSPPNPNKLHLYGTNREVDEHNSQMLQQFQNAVTLTATDTTQSSSGAISTEPSPINFHASEACMLPSSLNLAPKCRVMVIANVDVPGM